MYSLRWLRDPAPIFSGTVEEIKTFLDKWFERDVGPVEIGYGGVGDYCTWAVTNDDVNYPTLKGGACGPDMRAFPL